MAEEASSVPASAVLTLDRFISASSGPDAVESLEAMVAGFKSKEEMWEQSWILNNTEVVDHLTHLLQHGTLKNGDLPCGDEGINLVCQLYQTSLAKNSHALKEPQPGQLLEALLDVMDNSDRQIYTRVLALQVLEQLSRSHSSLASSQWLQAPNGLHRLADMLSLGIDNPVEEVIRNQALAVAHFLAREAPISKVFLFAEVETKLLDLCWQQGGLTKGNSVVLDSLKLVEEMLKHADSNLQDLVWQRPSVPPRLAQLIDLRGADQFLHSDEYKKKQKVKPNSIESNDDDDLDSLLQSGDSKKQQSPKKEGQQQDWFIPRLSSDEESIVESVIRILHLLLESESLRPTIWKAHGGICSLVWELALVNPANPPVCAMPSSNIQQKALELVAMKFNDLNTMDRHTGLDRLLFLVCTGGANAQDYKGKIATSQTALSVLRKTIDTDRVHELLLHTLAPLPEDEGAPAGPTVVEKLWNTVVENLSMSSTNQEDDETRSIFLSGALGGLSLLLCDEQSREMMSRVVPDAVNPDIMLEALKNEENSMVRWALLRFLCEWIMETPLMVQKLFNSSASTNLAGMASDSKKDYAPLVHLLLGLAMEYLPGDEHDCGGWTRTGILQVIKKIGISKFTTSLEGLKKVQNCDLPCYVSPLERSHWNKWYGKAVWIVRKRVVDELTGGEPSSESDAEEGETTHSSTTDGGSNKHLQKLISQQAKEMETLRQEVENATIKISSQEHQLDTWKRRMESTPTQLDGLLSEMTNKTANLEETISKLESQAKEAQTVHEQELNKLIKQLTEARQEVETSRAAEKEAIDGWERMEQELGALSHAYSSLEQDFQQEKNSHAAALAAAAADTAAGTPAGESAAQEQPHGERSDQRNSNGGSLEVATLRAENDRLKNDARAADEWMKMAVDKMNEMGQNGARLQQESEALKAQIKTLENQEAANKVANVKQSGEREGKLQQEVSRLEAQLLEEKGLRAAESGNAEEQVARYEETRREMQEHITRLELQLHEEKSSSQAFAADAKQTQEKYKHVEEEMKKHIVALEAALNEERQSHQGPASDSNELQSNHEAIVEELRQQIFNLEARLEQTPLAIQDGALEATLNEEQQSRHGPAAGANEMQANHDAIVEELRQQIFNLEAQLEQQTTQEIRESEPLAGEGPSASGAADEHLEAVKRELETSREHFDEDIYKKESRIRELENRLASGLGPYNIEDIRARDEEIEELRGANEAAQEWMAKAVEHHQTLATQVAKLSDEKAALTGKIEHLDRQPSVTSSNTDTITQLESQLQQKVELVEQLSAELAQCKGELMKLKEERDAIEDTEQDLSIARDEILSLQEKVQQLESRNDENDRNALSSEHERLQSSNAELQAQLDQFTAWAEQAQKKIAEILSEKQAHETTIKNLTESNMRLAQNEIVLNKSVLTKEAERSQLETSVVEKDKLVTELTSEKVKFVKEIAALAQQAKEAESQLETLRAEKNVTEKSTEDRHVERETLEKDKEFLDEQISSLEVAINEELDEINDGAKSSTVEERDEIAKLREELEAAHAALARDEDVVHQWEDRVAELESTIQSLESQIEEQEKEANNVVSQWQESFSEAEEKCASLEKELCTMRSGIESPRGDLDDAMKDRVTELETAVQSLESQLKEQEKEAYNAISQWQESYTAADEKCAALETELTALRSGMAPDGIQSDGMQDRVLQLESTVQSLESQLQEQEKEASDVVLQWEESYTAADEKCAALETELASLRSKMEAFGGYDEKQARISELESTVQSLELQLQDQEKEASDAVSQWEESYTAADEKCAALETELATVRSEIEASAGLQNGEIQERILELESTVQSLQSQLHEQEKEASGTVSQWQQSYTAAAEKCSGLENELLALRSETDSGLQSDEMQERISELESTVQTLESQLHEQEKEASGAVSQWQQSYTVAAEKSSGLENELSAVRSEMDSGLQSDEMQDRITELESIVQSLESQLQEQEKEANGVVSQWHESYTAAEEKCAAVERELATVRSEMDSGLQSDEMQEQITELESTVQSLESQLQAQEREASDVVSQWQESYTAAEEKCATVEKELATVRSEMDSLDVPHSDEMQERITELESTIQSLESQLQEQERGASDVVSQWQESYTAAEEKCSALENELSAVRSEMEVLKANNDDKTRDELAADKIRIQELEEKITNLVEEIGAANKAKKEQQELSKKTLSNLEKELSVSNASCADLKLQLQKLQEEGASIRRALDEKSSDLEESNRNREALEAAKQTLEQEYTTMRQQIESNPPERVSGLAEQLQQSERSLAAAQEALRNDEEVVRQWEERASELESTIEDLETQLQEQESEANTVISEWQRQSSDLETQLTQLQDQIARSNETLAARDATIENLKTLDSDISSQHKALLEDTKRLRGELDNEKRGNMEAEEKIRALAVALDKLKTESTDSSKNLTNQIAGLDATIEKMRLELEEKEESSRNATKAWESKVAKCKENIYTLEAELDSKNKSLADLQNEASQSNSLDSESAIAEYRQKVSALEADLAAKSQALSGLQEATQKDASESDSKLAEYEDKIFALEADIESKIESMSNLKDDVAEKSEALSRQELELEALGNEIAKQKTEIEDLENEILSKTEEIEGLKQSSGHSMAKTELVASRAENELLNEKLQLEQEARKSEAEQFEEALAAESSKLQEARDEVEDIRKESEDVVNQWTARVDELEGTVVELEKQLQQQEEEANVAISSWESKALELEKELETCTEELNALKQRLADTENSTADAEVTRNLEEEKIRLTLVVGQLEDELREANSMIQTYVTNEAAEKATEIAASALRDEIDELQRTIDGYKQQLADEESAREVAELEIERLLDDIATLAALANEGESIDGIELRTVRAAEHLKKKERIEIESLRNSLYRALNDVENAQTAEREAVNQLAKMQLATSIAEKDIVTAKSEIHFLSQALEESRLAEENRRASLEYRISSLEDDNDLLRRYHADELEEVRQELSQITMEKDRAIHQVRELERSNAAFVAAASKEDIYALDDQADLEHEIARLRVEHEHLLTVAADDKARAERKLREMLAAQMASIEADTILEHELRVNAEETVVGLKAQVEELLKASHADGHGNGSEMSASAAAKQIASLQEALDQVTKEKKNLKQKLEREASKAKASIEKSTEECRQAQSELHKMMRDNRYDQAVKTEASRLHLSPPRKRMPMTPETRDDVTMQSNLLDTSMTSINAATFDHLQNFKEEMREERKIYLELLSEHDDLLALLAQLDVEKNFLKDALTKIGGQAAVDEALKKAEDETFEEHGGVIKLADEFAAVTDME
ncbi:unnamed protein product [Cylindrotheca closterium]|uniref:Vesicle tethering protein Uso1/P115-like head domain-containing protein n=1 Tax=Cylindrotheca closterium TaxID=2856 RepID=A0AAD2FU99_9STRA|nr:unnamed protein product [Cylindrotheca closterium]